MKTISITVAIAAAVCGFLLAQDNKPSPADQALQRLETIKNTTSQPAAIYVNQLRMLAEQVDVSSGPERPYGFEYYSKCLEKVRAAKDKSALEWLGGILQLEDISNDILQTSPYCTVSRMYEDFSRAWYELQWDNLSVDDKMKVAFYGFIPGSPVAPHPKISVEYIAKIGKDARKRVYEILMDKNLKFDMSTPYKTWRVGYWEDLLSQDIFKPTDDELKNIYANGGECGKMAVLNYAISSAKPYAIEWIKDACKENASDPRKAYEVLNLRNYISAISADDKKKLLGVLIELGNDILKRVQSNCPLADDGNILNLLCIHLDMFDKNDDAAKLLENFLRAREKIDLNVVWKAFVAQDRTEYLYAYVFNLDEAATQAKKIIKNWSAKDEDE